MEEAGALSTILAVIGVIGGGAGIAALLKVRGENAKLQAEAAQIIQRTAIDMVEQYSSRVKELERKVGKLERQLRQWQRYAQALVDLARRHNLESELPCPPGDEEETLP